MGVGPPNFEGYKTEEQTRIPVNLDIWRADPQNALGTKTSWGGGEVEKRGVQYRRPRLWFLIFSGFLLQESQNGVLSGPLLWRFCVVCSVASFVVLSSSGHHPLFSQNIMGVGPPNFEGYKTEKQPRINHRSRRTRRQKAHMLHFLHNLYANKPRNFDPKSGLIAASFALIFGRNV